MNHPNATFEIIYCNIPKTPFQHGETTKKSTKQQGDGFEVQAATAPGPTFELTGGRRE
jgi:hypothetical protein